jgi:hypothetical protein
VTTAPDHLDAGFETAVANHGVRRTDLLVAGRPLRLEAAGTLVADALRPAFAPLAVGASGRTGDDPIADGHPTPGGPSEPAHLRVWVAPQPPALWDPAPAGPRRAADGGIAVSRPAPAALEAFTAPDALVLWGSPAAFASGDVRAHPASTAIAAWLARSGAQVLHVGAVATPAGAALLLGPSGAGKSTTVLAAAAHGLGVLGDDLCIVTLDEGPRVHALYGTAKVTATSRRHLDLGAPEVLGRTPRDKEVVALGGPLRLVDAAPVVALVVLEPPDPQSAPVRGPVLLAGRQVARHLAPTALKAALGAGDLQRWLHAAATLARQVPGYAVRLGWDLPAVSGAVSEAIDRGAQTAGRAGGGR